MNGAFLAECNHSGSRELHPLGIDPRETEQSRTHQKQRTRFWHAAVVAATARRSRWRIVTGTACKGDQLEVVVTSLCGVAANEGIQRADQPLARVSAVCKVVCSGAGSAQKITDQRPAI